jgi:hypothetical protein
MSVLMHVCSVSTSVSLRVCHEQDTVQHSVYVCTTAHTSSSTTQSCFLLCQNFQLYCRMDRASPSCSQVWCQGCWGDYFSLSSGQGEYGLNPAAGDCAAGAGNSATNASVLSTAPQKWATTPSNSTARAAEAGDGATWATHSLSSHGELWGAITKVCHTLTFGN